MSSNCWYQSKSTIAAVVWVCEHCILCSYHNPADAVYWHCDYKYKHVSIYLQLAKLLSSNITKLDAKARRELRGYLPQRMHFIGEKQSLKDKMFCSMSQEGISSRNSIKNLASQVPGRGSFRYAEKGASLSPMPSHFSQPSKTLQLATKQTLNRSWLD